MANGITPVLVSASHSGSIEMTTLLLEKGADVNKLDKAGISPLAEAAECGHTALAKLLIEAGADLEVAGTQDGMTALLLASQAGYDEFVQLLIAGLVIAFLFDKSIVFDRFEIQSRHPTIAMYGSRLIDCCTIEH